MRCRSSSGINQPISARRLDATTSTQHCEYRNAFTRDIETVTTTSRPLLPFIPDWSRRTQGDNALPPLAALASTGARKDTEKVGREPVFPSTEAPADGPRDDRYLTPDSFFTIIKEKYERELPMLLEYREKGYNETALILDTSLLSALLTDIRSHLPEDSADSRTADLMRRVEITIEDLAQTHPQTAKEKSEMFARIQALKWLLSALQSAVQAMGAWTFGTRETSSTENRPLNRKGREKARETIDQYLATAATYTSRGHGHTPGFSDLTLDIHNLCIEFLARIVPKPKYTNECYSHSSLISQLNRLSGFLRVIRSNLPPDCADNQAAAAMHRLENVIESLKNVCPQSEDGQFHMFHRVQTLTWLLEALRSTVKAMAPQDFRAPHARPLELDDRRRVSASIDKALARVNTHESRLRAESPCFTEAVHMVRDICADFSRKIKPRKTQIASSKIKKNAGKFCENTNRNFQGVRRSLISGRATISSASTLGINNLIRKAQPSIYLDLGEGEHLRINTESLLDAISWHQGAQLNLISCILNIKDKLLATTDDRQNLNALARHTRDALNKVAQREVQFREDSETVSGRQSGLKNASAQIYELMKDFWEYEQRIKKALESADSYRPEHIANEAEEFTHCIAVLMRRIDSVIARSTGRSLDIFSRDSRIARHAGAIFWDTKRELAQAYPDMDSSRYDEDLEAFVQEHVARDFVKATSPEGRTMASRVLRAYRDAQDGTLLQPLSTDDILTQVPIFSDYMAKSGVKSLSGRVTFALLSGNPGFLIPLATGMAGIPLPGLLKVLVSPITSALRYRQLARSPAVGQPWPAAHIREWARRQFAIEATRVTRAFLPRGIKVGLAAGLTGYATKQFGASKVAAMARGQLPSDLLWSGGGVGVMFAATSAFPALVEKVPSPSLFDERNDDEKSRTKRDLPSQERRIAAQRAAHEAVSVLSTEKWGPLPPEKVKELEENFDSFYNSAYPQVGFEMNDMIRAELADILKNNGGGHLTPDSTVEYEIEEHSAGAGETAGEAAGTTRYQPPKKVISLYDLARGQLYKKGWNGHIRVKNLPSQLAGLFRMNNYYGSSTFEITKMIEERISDKLEAYRHGPSKTLRALLWEGKIRRRLWDLKNPEGSTRMDDALAWQQALHTVSLKGMTKPFKNIFAVEKNSDELLLVDINKGRAVSVPKNAPSFTEAKKKELRELFLSNMSISDYLKYSKNPDWDGFSPEKDSPYSLLFSQAPIYSQRIQISAPKTVGSIARELNNRELETAQHDADFLLTNAAAVRVHSLIQLGLMSTEALSYVMLVAPPGKAMLVANIVSSVSGPLLSEAARANEREPEAREAARKARNNNIIASTAGLLGPEVARRAWTKYNNFRGRLL